MVAQPIGDALSPSHLPGPQQPLQLAPHRRLHERERPHENQDRGIAHHSSHQRYRLQLARGEQPDSVRRLQPQRARQAQRQFRRHGGDLEGLQHRDAGATNRHLREHHRPSSRGHEHGAFARAHNLRHERQKRGPHTHGRATDEYQALEGHNDRGVREHLQRGHRRQASVPARKQILDLVKLDPIRELSVWNAHSYSEPHLLFHVHVQELLHPDNGYARLLHVRDVGHQSRHVPLEVPAQLQQEHIVRSFEALH
mmetsp:Transcript_50204/g.134679  ORF Transcript_50204/g.134679 Transcript_50204/m.134679 type:complete len:254 (-) Transcript_50204:699-1460(-)